MPIFGPKCQFWAKFGRFWAKNPFFGGMEQNFWYPHIREQMKHLFRVENIDRCGFNWPLRTIMCNFNPKIWIFTVSSGYPNPTRYPVFHLLPDPTRFSFENHRVAGNSKYRVLPEISGKPGVSGITRYIG